MDVATAPNNTLVLCSFLGYISHFVLYVEHRGLTGNPE